MSQPVGTAPLTCRPAADRPGVSRCARYPRFADCGKNGSSRLPFWRGGCKRKAFSLPRAVADQSEVGEAGTESQDADEGVVHVLWMNGGLSCDGDSVALTAATQPSVEEIVLGALPGLPKIAVHWPLIDYECGPEQGADNFIEWWHKADRGELEPFVLIVEGSIPNEAIKDEGYWAAFGNNPATGQPMTDLRVARPARAQGHRGRGRRHLRDVRRHPRDVRQPHGRDGRARLPRLGLEVQGRAADRVRPRLPDPPRQPLGDAASTCSTRSPARRR